MFEDQTPSFVKLSRDINFIKCKKKKTRSRCSKEPMATWVSQGSGSVVATNSLGSFILTAEHVCANPADDAEFVEALESRFLSSRKKEFFKITTKHKATSYSSQIASLDVIATDEELDVCLVFAENIQVKPLKRFYGTLEIGKKYYNIAAPLNTFEPGMVPLFEGYYVGRPDRHRALFSIPAIGGSSGSPVIDSEGRLVSMIHSVIRGFDHLSFGPELKQLNMFIDDNIKDYHDKWYKNMLQLTRPEAVQ